MRRPVWLPPPEHELLLCAALLEGEAAGDAWVRWRESHGEERNNAGTFRLLPLVYKNLSAQGMEDPWMGRLKGIYRRSWFVNQRLFDHAAKMIARLEAAGIPTLLLKGAGLALAHYQDAGARPMDDVDVAVPFARVADAVAVLREAGLRPARPLDAELIAVSHAETLIDDEDHELDLHWDLLRWAGRDEEIWEDAVPVEIRGAATRAPSATDQVLLVCAHAAYWNVQHPMRWVADLHVLLRSPIDWDRLERLAAARGVTEPLAVALAYIRERFAAPVPAEAIAAIRARPSAPLRRAAHRVCALPPSPARSAGLLAVYLDTYLARSGARGRRGTPWGFVRSVELHLGVEQHHRLPARIVQGLRQSPV